MKKPPECPICGVEITPDQDGKPTTQHDQAAHERRKQEDWLIGAKQRERELPRPGRYDPPGDPTLPAYVRSLIERRPDLKDDILREYEQGLARQRLEPDQPAPRLPLKAPEPDLTPPRRVFGYDPDE